MRIGSFQVSLEHDQSREEKAFADLKPEEREKCREFWLKFRILERSAWGVFLVALIVRWAFHGMAPTLVHNVFRLAVLWWLVSLIWLFNLYCPRCGAKFSGSLLALLPANPGGFRRYPHKCYGCDLSRSELKYISQHTG